MRIAVFGAGGVGGYLAARLADAGTAEVALLARGAHLEALRADGLRLRSVFGDAHVRVPATDDPGDIGPVDAVLFTVKATDTHTAAGQLGPLLGEGTAVVSFQNGVDNEDRITATVGGGHVLGGVAFIFSTIAAPGVIEHSGGPTRFVFGELDGRRSQRAQGLQDVLRAAGVDAELTSDVRAAMWRKFIFICAQAGMTAASRLPLGALRGDEEAWRMYRAVITEAAAVADAEGIGLPDDAVEGAIELAESLEHDAFSSLHYDLEHGKPMELDALNGHVARLGRRHGVDVPANEAIYALLSPWAAANRRD